MQGGQPGSPGLFWALLFPCYVRNRTRPSTEYIHIYRIYTKGIPRMHLSKGDEAQLIPAAKHWYSRSALALSGCSSPSPPTSPQGSAAAEPFSHSLCEMEAKGSETLGSGLWRCRV